MNVNQLKDSWFKWWALKYCLLGASIIAFAYPEKVKNEMSVGLNSIILTSRKGHTTAFVKTREVRNYGLVQIKNYVKDNDVSEFCILLKKKTEEMFSIMKNLLSRDITDKEFIDFADKVQEYIGYYAVPRQIIDYIEPERVSFILEDLRVARLYAEPIFTIVEEVIQKYLSDLSRKISYSTEALSTLTLSELKEYVEKGKIIDENELKRRYEHSAFILTPDSVEVTSDENIVNALEKINLEISENFSSELIGTSAFRGKVRGTARIIFDPFNFKVFNEGDVLITGMTRPDYLPLMNKASAIVTDVGGLLCHAAIVAREIGKPCVIGTKTATKTFKDGDIVEVDADNGIVRGT